VNESTRDRLDVAAVIRLAVIVLASIAAAAGFRAVFVDWSFLFAAVLGGIGAGLVVLLSWWRRLLVGESLAISVIGFVLVGAVAVELVPTLASFGSLFDGLRSGWAELLSLTPPIDDTPELRALPFALAWIGATVGGELLRRTTTPMLPAIGPLITLSVSVLVTAEDRAVAVTQGIVISIAVLVIGISYALRAGRRPEETGDVDHRDAHVESASASAPTTTRITRAARAAAVLALVAVAAPLVGPRLPLADANDRFDLRDQNVPPWDPLATPSPLVELKAALKDDVRDDPMFTVAADEPIGRIQLAVLGDYDGVVWTVGSSSGRDAATEFRPVSRELADRPEGSDAPTRTVRATIAIDGLRGPWLPAAGWPDSIRFETTDDAGTPTANNGSLRMNLTTGTLAVPAGVTTGMTYELVIDQPDALSSTELAELDVAPTIADDDLEVIPPAVRNIAADILEGTDRGWDRAAAIQRRFVDDGFYDVSAESRPGHSYFRLAEFLDDPDRLIGFEEQYAAAAATIARIAQLEARVVVGYVIPDDRYVDGIAEVLSEDIRAWVEVDFGSAGWIPLDVTPDRSREPTAEATGITVEEVAVPSPPPPPQIPPSLEVFAEEEEPEEEDEEDEEDEEESTSAAGGVTPLALGGGIAGGLLLLVVIVLGAIALWKARRRARRRQESDAAAAVSNAWVETLDRYTEAGLRVPPRSTPQEAVRTLATAELAADDSRRDLRGLALVVQRSAYHEQPPRDDEANRAWQYYDDVVDALRDRRSPVQRVRMAVDPRTLRSPAARRDEGRV
jgi:transglutaminase-like putative cysteine protease